MHILLLVKRLDYGGAENHVTDLANTLACRGHRVVVCAGPGRRAALLDHAVGFRPTAYSDMLLLERAFELARLAAREGMEVIHAHQRLPTHTGCTAGQIAHIPCVATLHGLVRHDLRSRSVRSRLAHVITISPFWHDVIRRRDSALAEKTTVIPNAVRVGARDETAAAPYRLLYASRLNDCHGEVLEMVIRAIPALADMFPRLELHVAGDGPRLRALERAAGEVNARLARPAVRLVGYQPDISPLAASAGLVLGVGRVALEALAQGAPVLAVNRHHLGRPVTRESFPTLAYTNFVPREAPPPEPTTLRAAVGSALAEQARLAAEASLLRHVVRAEYELDAAVAKTVAVYETAAKQAEGAE